MNTATFAQKLTEKARDKLADIHKVSIGVPGEPFPMVDIVAGDRNSRATLGAISGQNGSMTLLTERPYEEVLGLLTRNMPAPNMLRLLLDACQKRSNLKPNANRVDAYIGDPGLGKTHLAQTIALAQTKRGALTIDCGGRDLNELFYETVMDKKSGKPIFDKIDEKLEAGQLKPFSVQQLKNVLGEGVKSDGNGGFSIDWGAIGSIELTQEESKAARERAAEKAGQAFKNKPQDSDDYREALQGFEIAELGGARQARKEHNKEIVRVINEVAANEGILAETGSSGINLVQREGALIRAWYDNRPPILDEYNKAIPGTDGLLQDWWIMMIGQKTQCSVRSGDQEFTFDRNDMPPLYYVTLTGNKTKDGASTFQLPVSVADRVQPKEIPHMDEDARAHAFTQDLTGLPITTLYNATKGYWDKHSEQFGAFLRNRRTLGLSEEEIQNIPAWQFEMLDNWKQVKDAAQQAGTFYKKWADALDSESAIGREMSDNSLGALARVEIDEDRDYRYQVTVGRRRQKTHTLEAETPKPFVGSSGDAHEYDFANLGKAKPQPETPDEPTEKGYGSRLEQVILEDIHTTTINKPNFNAWLIELARSSGVIPPKVQEADVMDENRLATRLNIGEKREVVPEDLQETHHLLAEYVREEFAVANPGAAPRSPNDVDIISPTALEHALTQVLNTRDEDRRPVTRMSEFTVPEVNIGSAKKAPLVAVVGGVPPIKPNDVIADETGGVTTYVEDKREQLGREAEGLDLLGTYETSDLLDTKRFLVSLAIPGMREHNIKGLWNKFHRSHSRIEDGNKLQESETLRLVDNIKDSQTGLGVQLVVTKTKDADGTERDDFLYVIHDLNGNEGRGKTLITGTTEIGEAYQQALAKQGVTYVNRKDANAKERIAQEVEEIFGNKPLYPGGQGMDMNFWAESAVTDAIQNHLLPVSNGDQYATSNYRHYYMLPNHLTYLNCEKTEDGRIETQPFAATFGTEKWRQEARENLVALLADQGCEVYVNYHDVDYFRGGGLIKDEDEQVKGEVLPFLPVPKDGPREEGYEIVHKGYLELVPPGAKRYMVMTQQPDLDQVKHQLRVFEEKWAREDAVREQQASQQASAGRGA